MPKLIIPNAYELYQPKNIELTQEQINARYYYNLRFLWLLEPGDAILLPKPPAKGFMAYLAKVKKIDPDSLHLIILEDTSLCSEALSDPHLIAQLKNLIISPREWTIQACYFSQEVYILAEKLDLSFSPEWKKLVEADFIRHANSKAHFRRMAASNHIPIPAGVICSTQEDLANSIQQLIKITGQVILKQEYNASGKGNIGISINENANFVGVIKTLILNDQCLNEMVEQLWRDYIDSTNNLLIVEVYHPNQGSFTAQFWCPPRGQEATLLNTSEILMESRWVGVQIPGRLSAEKTKSLVTYSKQLADIVQEQGYQGYLCCDAILTNDNHLLFTEVNVRPGAETHAYILAQQLFGVGFESEMVVLTRDGLYTDSFLKLYQRLQKENLLLGDGNAAGLILLTVDDNYSKKFEYLVAAPDLMSVYALEERLNNLL